jgi:hypothetical protein
MIYIFDTSSLLSLKFYYPEQFPTFWENFNILVEKGDILSVKEVFVEIEEISTERHLFNWCAANKEIFKKSGSDESNFIAEIFKVRRFRDSIGTEGNTKSYLYYSKLENGIILSHLKVIINYDIKYRMCKGLETEDE